MMMKFLKHIARASTCGKPTSIYAFTQLYHNILPNKTTSRDLRLGHPQQKHNVAICLKLDIHTVNFLKITSGAPHGLIRVYTLIQSKNQSKNQQSKFFFNF